MAQQKLPATEHGINSSMLAWSRDDIENRFGFKGGRYTSINQAFAFLLGMLLATIVYVLILFVASHFRCLSAVVGIFTRFNNQFAVAPATFFFCTGMAILCLKSRKVRFQEQALRLAAVPDEPDFILTEATAATVLVKIHELVDHPRHFVLLNRIDRALSNFRNMGEVNDVSAILRAQAENDEDQVASSYTLLNGMVWAIPVLGFIGTVLGLSLSIGQFTSTLQEKKDISEITQSLKGVTGGLSTAFESTLVALTFTLFLQLAITFQQKREMTFLDECNDYCHANIVSKLRLVNRVSLPPETVPPKPQS